ncbi:hypothetical protein DPMN_095174 [Dreissena polymorpha]|uniref:Uncharacterized protein n=1 Tax=Dreissena polymorpha TaxID=45954 RepID=A0A9D4R2H3_DREPO|nr:hypothetical protein DPMN_095174 [Dreissena polymorpha]
MPSTCSERTRAVHYIAQLRSFLGTRAVKTSRSWFRLYTKSLTCLGTASTGDATS